VQSRFQESASEIKKREQARVYVRDRHGERNEADETDTNEQERGQKRKKAKNQKIET